MTKIGDAKRKLHGMITGKPDNFSWIIEEKLAGSAIPTSKEEIDWIKQEGVKSIVTIREEPLDENRWGWGQQEDVEWSQRVRDKYKYVMNQYSTVKSLKEKKLQAEVL